ncbi:MAG: hypothetical protein ABSA30_07200 [Candidatus Aminicenantales bacterium]|jgi:hypothetical protein
MIEAEEHFYADDPAVGPADVRTRLKDASYFFIGNGLIQGAVQFAPAGEGTPVGLLIMDPEVLGPKRAALTMDPEHGLDSTAVEISAGGTTHRARAASVSAGWDEGAGAPTVRAEWSGGGFEITERFSCPDRNRPVIVREIVLRNAGPETATFSVRTGVPRTFVERTSSAVPSGTAAFALVYALDAARRSIGVEWAEHPVGAESAVAFNRSLASVASGDPLLDRFFQASKSQLPAAISRTGRLDGGIWQYNREWVRDQSVIAEALASLGAGDIARTMIERLAGRFVTDEGDTVDSGERRASDEIELDQNGYLLRAILRYALWTGDEDVARRLWPRISALAEFPLRGVFRHAPSGLLMNRREYWERHRLHGIETGIELAHQVMVTAGLDAAAALARLAGRPEKAIRWAAEAARLHRAWLEDRAFRMADNRGFIKRRGPAGPVQETITAGAEAGLPEGVPLCSDGAHYLNPDTSVVFPILLGLVPSESPVAALTLSSLEALWNQAWTGGGYGRYHFTSEPDSAGPWPFASLFVARAAVESGRFDLVRRVLDWMGSVPGAVAGSWFEFYGRRLSPPFPQIGVIPWTWAEIIHLTIENVLGVRPLENGLLIRPRFLPESGPARADLAVRGIRLRLEIEPDAGRTAFEFETDTVVLERNNRSILIEYPRRDAEVRVR